MCPGGPSNTQPWQPAAVCRVCSHYEWASMADRMPGFSGAQCESFVSVHAASVGTASSADAGGSVCARGDE